MKSDEMTFILILMQASMFIAWLSICLSHREPANLKVVLASVRTQALASGVVVLTALMPAVVSSVRVSSGGPWPMLPIVYGMEGAFCLATILIKTRREARIWKEWRAHLWETAVRSGIV
jgi:hypothetical protein